VKYRFVSIVSIQYFLWKIGLKYVKAFRWERNLAEKIPKIIIKMPVDIRLASIGDFKGSPILKDEALKRLSKGDLGFIAIWNGMIIGYLWVSLKREAYIPEFERAISLKNGEAYLYDTFIFPDFRRKGLNKKLLEEMLHYLKSQNVKKANTYVLTTNKAPQKALRALGFRPVRLVKFVKIFRFKKFEEHELKARVEISNSFKKSLTLKDASCAFKSR